MLDPELLSDSELIEALSKVAAQNKLLSWNPPPEGEVPDGKNGYIYDWQRRFHDAGAWAKERLLMCANGVGKSETISAETAFHATGTYPEWWTGHRFQKGGFEIWVGSIDNDMQKIGLQKKLLGPGLDSESGLGTGFLPAHTIRHVEKRQAGVKGVADEILVEHASGERVKIKFKTYEQGWRRWQSGDPKVIVWDEEPDENNVEQAGIHAEVLTRLVRNNGIFYGGYTPLIGETPLTTHFMHNEDAQIWWIGATWDDAPHMTEEDKSRVMAGYPDHQREARSKGIPMMGEGRIFTTAESDFVIDPIPIPDHWARINGVDFGMAHPAALACLAWDRDTDIVYLVDVWKQSSAKTRDHCDAIKSRGEWIPVSWPHDGEKRDPRSGEKFANIYRNTHGVNMLAKSARYKNDTGGSQAQWPVIEDMRIRLDSGKFKVFRTCQPWLTEYRSYHTKDGQIVSRNEDALKASFYALMMLRYAGSKSQGRVRSNVPAAFTTGVQ